MDSKTSATSLFRQTGPSVDPVAFRPESSPSHGFALPAVPQPIDTQTPQHDDEHAEPHRYRTIWLSDIHLGSSGCQAPYLLDFLRHNESEYLYLVGDIIDGLAFGDIHVRGEAFHTTLAGKRLWIVHGDLFDGVIQHAKWLAYLGDTLYTMILILNRWFNRIRSRLGFPYWSLSQYLKHQVKNAVNFISSFERVMTDEARRRGCDGVVCGHIHKAEIRDIDGVLYCNDGDWVESLSALVETYEGELKVIYWTAMRSPQAGVQKARATA
jgi:UDP-2,3-diacylglucosamine pyrophosphatase LpxH